MASRTRMLESVRHLRWREVEAGLAADPSLIAYRDDRGRNFLHICCGVDPGAKKLSPDHGVRTADALLGAGIDVNQEAFREGNWKATPLWYAISRGRNLPLARHLLRRGSGANHCLWAAAYADDLAAIALLLEHGADIEAVAEDETPFLSAVKSSRFRAAEALLDRGATVDFQDSRGMTALHYMLKKDSDKRHFRMLLRYGPRGDLKNAKGETAAGIMSRKRDPDFRRMANELSIGRVQPCSESARDSGLRTRMKKSGAQSGTSPSQLIDARIRQLGDWRGTMLSRLRTMVKEADPDVVEEWKWRGVPVWSHDGLICTGETYKNVVKMTFAKGAALKDPSGLFNSSLDGNTRRAIDFHEGEKIDEKALKALVRAAVALNRSGARR